MIITQTFTMARWQIVVIKPEATNQTKNKVVVVVVCVGGWG